MKEALYEVKIGLIRDEVENWRHVRVLAKHVLEAIKKAKLTKEEYASEVNLIGRVG